ncbi:hypothetical protein BD324DRAFT_325540 [Kockovaella imperatae]|uniref:Peptidase C15, pyroglutamyl peptidase I-like protein n=1 Tax=Kockovaella imperatae TaxID=4999 RepID=A0A1Y1UP57_9TREE|nr:hypothetical protein BD324DRAFT_325540 [Kockovaella imperatae]ORX39327.1 hypothetical protein BD324DRAFT_325540 [Kockovaella imperatae]
MVPAIDRTEQGAETVTEVVRNEQRPIRVLVTGFGPWASNTVNPSNSVASKLPSHLPGTSGRPPIEVIVKSPIPVSYHKIHESIPKLLEDVQADYVLHMGLHGGRPTFDLELSAPRTGFVHPDVDTKCWTLEEGDKVVPGQSVLPYQLDKNAKDDDGSNVGAEPSEDGEQSWPDRLETQLKRDKVVEIWQERCKEVPNSQVTGNDGVGTFCCGFIYYTSLAWYKKQNVKGEGQKTGPVLFLHMPNLQEEHEVEMGKQVVIRLIEAIVEAST